MLLVCFIIRIYHSAWSSECQICLSLHVCRSVWNKKPTRRHLVFYLFLLYKLLNMFRATFCPSSGPDDLVVFLPHVVWCRGCVGSQIRLAGCVSTGEYVAQLCTPQWI